MFEGDKKQPRAQWPKTGLLLSAVYLALMFSLPCLGEANCPEYTAPPEQYRSLGSPFVVLCAHSKCTVAEEQRQLDKRHRCGGVACWIWGAGSGYLVLIEDDPVALFTALLFVSTALLWWVTQQTLSHAERATERELRAYISISKRVVVAHKNAGVATCTVTIKNFGQTPAYNMGVDWRIWVDEMPNSKRRHISDFSKTTSKFSLPPSDELNLNSHLRVASEIAEEIKRGQQGIWAEGCIRYEDAFGKQRHSPFRFYFSHDEITKEPRKMSLHGEGNHCD